MLFYALTELETYDAVIKVRQIAEIVLISSNQRFEMGTSPRLGKLSLCFPGLTYPQSLQAQFAILKVLLSTPNDFVTLSHSSENTDDPTMHFDKTRIVSCGIPTIGSFVQKLHIFISTADVVRGTKLFEEVTAVDDYFLRIREVVLRKKQPSKLFVQPNTSINKGEDGAQTVVLRDYEASREGIINSWAGRRV